MKKAQTMKRFMLYPLLAMLAACSNPENEETIRKQISDYQKQVSEINGKIKSLEDKLEGMGAEDPGAFLVPVKVSALQYTSFRHYIEVSGSAEAVNAAFISPEIGGQVRELFVEEGAQVQKGQVLARLNTEITEGAIAEVQSQLDLAKIVFEKQSRLWEKGIGSEIQYLNAKTGKESLEKRLETMKSQMDMAIIKSPVNGIVDEILVKKGELASPGMQMMQIYNLEEIYINADVSETYLPYIRERDTVKVMFPVYPDLSLTTVIYRKGTNINPNNRTFTIQLKLGNPQHLLKPNLLSVIHINDFSADSALTVPSIIIKQDIRGSYLYIAEKGSNKNIARKVYIQSGKSDGESTMVLEGLKTGQNVIVEGYNQVSDGTEIEVAPKDVS